MNFRVEEKCDSPSVVPRSKEWGIIFSLCFLSTVTFLELLFLNYISMKVFWKRARKRSEARILILFCVLSGVDATSGTIMTLRDIFYVFGECYKEGSIVLKSRELLRISEGYFLTFRSTILALLQIYYLLVYLRPYQSEFIANRVGAFTVILALVSLTSALCDEVVVTTKKCCKFYLNFITVRQLSTGINISLLTRLIVRVRV